MSKRIHKRLLGMCFCALLFGNSVFGFQLVHRRGSTWVGLKPGETFRLEQCELTEQIDPASLLRTDFIKRNTDKEPLLFYTHHRGIVVTLGHKGQLMLINDNEATKSNKVMIVDLETNLAKQIDSEARRLYEQNSYVDSRLIIVPVAYAFSPDDRNVLIKMELIYVSMSVGQEAERVARSYKEWWYVIDSKGGQVKHEYRTSELPESWWIF